MRFRPAHKQQALGKSIRQRSGRPAGRACEGAVEITTADDCWEASDQRRGTNAALTGGVCVSGPTPLGRIVCESVRDHVSMVVTVVLLFTTDGPLAPSCMTLYYQTCLSGG